MIYLLTQILLCLALAALLGGAIGWLLQSARGARRLDRARHALAAQARQLERAQGDVNMLTDDFDDLRERSRVEIDALRHENARLPALTDNLEKSQLLVRQMMQRHESRERELDAGKAALEERIARLQEQVVTHERALAAAARAADGRRSGRDGGALAALVAEADRTETVGTVSDDAPSAGPDTDRSADGADVASAVMASGDRPVAENRPADGAADTVAAERGATMPRRGWASLPLIESDVTDVADESLDEVMEVDDDLAAELREDVATRPSPLDGTDEIADAATDAVAGESEDGDDDWNDEDANATLAIEVFSMDDVHGVEDLDGPTDPPEAGVDDPDAMVERGDSADVRVDPAPLFDPVERQDDLKRLFGIGPMTEKALNALGITSYPQLAELERPEIERIAEALDIVPERIESDDWVGNARRQLEDVLEEL